MFFETRNIKAKLGGQIEVTANNHGVSIEDGESWVFLWWKEWNGVKKAVEELKRKHKEELEDINI